MVERKPLPAETTAKPAPTLPTLPTPAERKQAISAAYREQAARDAEAITEWITRIATRVAAHLRNDPTAVSIAISDFSWPNAEVQQGIKKWIRTQKGYKITFAEHNSEAMDRFRLSRASVVVSWEPVSE